MSSFVKDLSPVSISEPAIRNKLLTGPQVVEMVIEYKGAQEISVEMDVALMQYLLDKGFKLQFGEGHEAGYEILSDPHTYRSSPSEGYRPKVNGSDPEDGRWKFLSGVTPLTFVIRPVVTLGESIILLSARVECEHGTACQNIPSQRRMLRSLAEFTELSEVYAGISRFGHDVVNPKEINLEGFTTLASAFHRFANGNSQIIALTREPDCPFRHMPPFNNPLYVPLGARDELFEYWHNLLPLNVQEEREATNRHMMVGTVSQI